VSLEEETKGESNSHFSVVLRHLRFSMRNVDQRLDVARSGPIQAQPNEESASISPSSPSKLNLSPESFHPPSSQEQACDHDSPILRIRTDDLESIPIDPSGQRVPKRVLDHPAQPIDRVLSQPRLVQHDPFPAVISSESEFL